MKINNAELLLKVRGCWKVALKTQQFSTYMELKLRHAFMLYNYSRRRCKARVKQKQFIKIEMIIKEIIFNSAKFFSVITGTFLRGAEKGKGVFRFCWTIQALVIWGPIHDGFIWDLGGWGLCVEFYDIVWDGEESKKGTLIGIISAFLFWILRNTVYRLQIIYILAWILE